MNVIITVLDAKLNPMESLEYPKEMPIPQKGDMLVLQKKNEIGIYCLEVISRAIRPNLK